MTFGTPYAIGHGGGSSAASQVISVTTATSAGDTILVACGNSSSAGAVVSGITDSAGNSYARLISAAVTTNEFGDLWAALPQNNGGTTKALTTSNSITVTWSTTTGTKIHLAVGVSGVSVTAALDKQSTAHGTSTVPSVATGALTQAAEMVLGFLLNADTDAPTSLTLAQVSQYQSGTSPYATCSYEATASTSSVTYSGSFAASLNWAGIIVSLLPAPAAAVPVAVSPALPGLTWKRRFQPEFLHVFPRQPSQPAPAPPPGQPVVVQSVAFQGASGSFRAPTTAGNCVLLCIMDTEFSFPDNVTAVTLGGLAGNFTQLAPAEEDSNAYVWAWADPDCAGGQQALAVTLTEANDPVVIAYEISGLVSSGLLDVSSSGGSLTSSYSSGSTATTTQASEIWVGMASGYDGSGPLAGPPSPWINTVQNGSVGITEAIAGYQVVSATGTASYAGTAPGTSSVVAQVITLRAAILSVPAPYAPARPGATWKRRFQPESLHTYPRQPSQPVTCTGSVALAPMALSGTASTSAPAGGFIAATRAGRSWLRRFQPESLHLPPQQPSQPVTLAGSAAMAPMALQSSAAQSQPVPRQRPGLSWVRRFQPEALHLPPRQPSQPVTVTGSAALAPLALAGSAAQSQPVPPQRPGLTWRRLHHLGRQHPLQPSQPVTATGSLTMPPLAMGAFTAQSQPVPAQRPGAAWRARFRLGRMVPRQPSQGIIVSGSAAMAPMAAGGSAAQSVPVPPQRPGLAWRRFHRLGRMAPPQPSQPVTTAGSVTLAPVSLSGAAAAGAPQALPPKPAQPGRAWLRQFRRHQVRVSPLIQPVAATGSLAMAPMATGGQGAESYPEPAQRPGLSWRRAHRLGRMVPRQPSQPVTLAGALVMAPMGTAGSAAASYPVPSQRPGPAWRRLHRAGRQVPRQPSQPLTVTGSLVLAPLAIAGRTVQPVYVPPPQRPGLTWRRHFRLGRMAVPQPSQPVIARGSLVMAPLALAGSAAYPQPYPSQRPGATWRRFHRLGRQLTRQPSQGITSGGSLVLARMGLAGSASAITSTIAPARPGRTWQHRFRPRSAAIPAPPFQAAQEGASAAMSASGSMTVSALSGPGLENLWAAYLTAKQTFINARQALDLARTAYNTDFLGYTMSAEVYALDRAADEAYKAWAQASQYWQRELGIFAAYGGGR